MSEAEICARFVLAAQEYWKTSVELRSIKFGWLEDHMIACDSCAEKLEDVAEILLDQKKRLEGEGNGSTGDLPVV